jgi:F-type H+-transporting ATPase subunit b
MNTFSLFMAGGGGLLSFNSGFAIWVAISMVIFLFIMYKFALPPIMKALDDRETNIRESLEAAEKALAKAEEVSKNNEAVLREAEAKAQQIRKDAVKDAEVLRADRIEKTRLEAEKLLSDARATIEQEKKRALAELRKEVTSLAIEASTKILKENMDTEKNQKLINTFVDDLSKN